MKILIVEDDTLLLQGLILAAQTEGYACDGVTTARMAEQSLEAGHYSLVVLDLGLPDEDGLHFLARIRQKKYITRRHFWPIIFTGLMTISWQ